MAKRKNARMVPREVRAADTTARAARAAAMTAAERDALTIATHLAPNAGLALCADTWLALYGTSDDDIFPHERELRDALARQITRQTGHPMSADLAYAIIDPEH